MTGYQSKKAAALDEEGTYLVHQTDHQGRPMSYWGGVDFDINTVPPKRTWVGLTDDEINLLEELYAPPVHPDFTNDASHCLELIRHVEAKLKEKNT